MSKTYKIVPDQSLPAGEYYIGDPCYVIQDEEWDSALNDTRYFNLFKSASSNEYNKREDQHGVFSRNGHLFAVSTTAFGDGSYPLTAYRSCIGKCPVDAGCISAIPLNMLESMGMTKEKIKQRNDGFIVDFSDPFDIHYNEGTIYFGDDVYVDTDRSEWDLEDEDEDEGW